MCAADAGLSWCTGAPAGRLSGAHVRAQLGDAGPEEPPPLGTLRCGL